MLSLCILSTPMPSYSTPNPYTPEGAFAVRSEGLSRGETASLVVGIIGVVLTAMMYLRRRKSRGVSCITLILTPEWFNSYRTWLF